MVIKFFGCYRKITSRELLFTKWFDRWKRNIVTKGCVGVVHDSFSFFPHVYLRLKIYGLSVDPRIFTILGLYRTTPARKVYLYYSSNSITGFVLTFFIARKSSTVFRRRSNTFLKYRSQTTTTMFEISVKFFSFSFFSNFFLFLLFTEIPSSRGICCTFVTREVEKRKDCIKGRLESKEIFVFHSYKAHIFPR